MTTSLSLSAPTPAVSVDTAAARVAVAPPTGRLSLRARGDLAPLEAALGLGLPDRVGRCARTGETAALCLGPDEWTLTAPPDAVDGIVAALAEFYSTAPHSLVDISGREVTLTVDGRQAVDLLAIGCARDIDGIPVGEARRTGFDGIAIVLWRDGERSFRLDVWHSFAPALLDLLETGCRELAAEGA